MAFACGRERSCQNAPRFADTQLASRPPHRTLAPSFPITLLYTLASLLLSLPVQSPAQPEVPAAPAATTAQDWVQWERIGSNLLSPDGRFLAYSIGRGDGSGELRLRTIASDATEVFEQGSRPSFSRNLRWLAYSRGYSETQLDKLKEKKKPAENALGLYDLATNERSEVEGVSGFAFDHSGRYLAMRRYGRKGEENGADLVVRDLDTGIDRHIGRVGSYAWSDEGSLLALTIDAPDQIGNSIAVYDPVMGTQRVLDSAQADYSQLSWRQDSNGLAVMRERAFEDEEDSTQVVLAWRDVRASDGQTTRYDILEDETQDGEQRITTDGGLRWSDNGKVVLFGLKPWDKKPAELCEEVEEEAAKSDEEESDEAKTDKAKTDKDKEAPQSLGERNEDPAGVEVWHVKDVQIVPLQKKRASRKEAENKLCALWLKDARLVQLEDGDLEVSMLEGTRWALGSDMSPYLEEQRFSATQQDLYRVDVSTGARVKVLERVKYRYTGDPTARRVLFVRDNHIWSLDLETQLTVNLTSAVDVPFTNRETSTLTTQKPPYGVASWSHDGSAVYLYSRYDIWSFQLDGSGARQLTHGTAGNVRHRLETVAPDRDDERYLNLERGSYISLYGDLTKKSGYGHLSAAGCDHLIWGDAALGRLERAENADILVHTQERFDDSPDLFVSGPKLDDSKRASDTNPFQSEYTWGRAELVDYVNANGKDLQGALYYPAGYEAGKQYPMVVYIYEARSQNLHRYVTPTETHPYNASVFTGAGYFVFEPDIIYRDQNPGLSAVECVVPAVREVLSRGMVDEKRVGLMGHSWGAYQTAFIVTQTDLFAAGVAGAPLTNMMSMSMSIYWNSGQTDAYIFHESQGRMDRPFWDDVDTYIKNSPIFSVDDLKTPLLMTFGDKDGAVDWHQGVEFYNAARLAQSPLVMLVYPGENHGLRQKPNQIDYHHRVFDWFEHHLKDVPADDWITKGVPWLDQKKALEKDD